jgi:hypothetical protein
MRTFANRNQVIDIHSYLLQVSRLELGIWDAGYANSGWGGGPINWHNYKELDTQFDYIKVCAAFK